MVFLIAPFGVIKPLYFRQFCCVASVKTVRSTKGPTFVRCPKNDTMAHLAEKKKYVPSHLLHYISFHKCGAFYYANSLYSAFYSPVLQGCFFSDKVMLFLPFLFSVRLHWRGSRRTCLPWDDSEANGQRTIRSVQTS